MASAVLGNHRRKLEPFTVIAGQRQADQPPAIARHEVDGLGTHVIGGQNDVTLIFATLVVDQDDHAAGGQFDDKLGNRGS